MTVKVCIHTYEYKLCSHILFIWHCLHCIFFIFSDKNKTKTTEAPPAEKTRKPINIKDLPRETYSILSEGGHLQNMKTRRVRTINPLYIAVPIAGACVLLAIIVFAIYVLRRQNQYIEECRYHSNIRQSAYTKHPIIIKDIDSSSTKKMFYPDCERSSSGSETKLLMKV